MKQKKWTIEDKIRIFILILSATLLFISFLFLQKAEHYQDLSMEEEQKLLEKSINFSLAATFLSFTSNLVFYIVKVNQANWIYRLPNSYRLRQVSKKEIILERPLQDAQEPVLPDCIAEFCHNDRYICLQTGIPRKKKKRAREEVSDVMHHAEYYIVDTEQNLTYGPFSRWNLLVECSALCVGELEDWIPTMPRPHFAESI